jgi:hypothetical protein
MITIVAQRIRDTRPMVNIILMMPENLVLSFRALQYQQGFRASENIAIFGSVKMHPARGARGLEDCDINFNYIFTFSPGDSSFKCVVAQEICKTQRFMIP